MYRQRQHHILYHHPDDDDNDDGGVLVCFHVIMYRLWNLTCKSENVSGILLKK